MSSTAQNNDAHWGEPHAPVELQVEAILQAAEQAAADIRREAERWAELHMQETRRRGDELAAQRIEQLSSITDDLLARARAVARQSDQLVRALEAAGLNALDPGDEPRSNGLERGPTGAVSPGARLLVAQMARSGSSRERIAARLVEEFGIEDPRVILDEAGL